MAPVFTRDWGHFLFKADLVTMSDLVFLSLVRAYTRHEHGRLITVNEHSTIQDPATGELVAHHIMEHPDGSKYETKVYGHEGKSANGADIETTATHVIKHTDANGKEDQLVGEHDSYESALRSDEAIRERMKSTGHNVRDAYTGAGGSHESAEYKPGYDWGPRAAAIKKQREANAADPHQTLQHTSAYHEKEAEASAANERRRQKALKVKASSSVEDRYQVIELARQMSEPKDVYYSKGVQL